MTDSEIGKLRREQVLLDRAGRAWRVLHEPRQEAGTNWVMVASATGAQVIRLTYRNSDGFHLDSSEGSLHDDRL